MVTMNQSLMIQGRLLILEKLQNVDTMSKWWHGKGGTPPKMGGRSCILRECHYDGGITIVETLRVIGGNVGAINLLFSK